MIGNSIFLNFEKLKRKDGMSHSLPPFFLLWFLILLLDLKMEFIAPSTEGFTIYTKSNCPYCTKVKELFLHTVPAPDYVNCDSYLEINREAFLEFIRGYTVREHRTFPMVFWKGTFIGGYTETKEYMDSNLFSADFTMNF
jgi:glutaredoxin